MRFTEVEGKSKEDAMEKAARELNVPVAEIGIEVLSDSSRGFFSLIGGRKVKIRAWSKRESRENLREELEKIRDEVGPMVPPLPREGAAGPRSVSRGTARNHTRAEPRALARSAVKNNVRAEPRSESRSATKGAPRAESKRNPPAESVHEKAAEAETKDPAVLAKSQEAMRLLEGILGWLTDQSKVHVRELSLERIRLEIVGVKSGLLIGKRGQTLDALQFLLNKMVNRTAEDAIRIEVDIEQYRKRREQSLQSMAVRLGEKVKKKGKPITVEAMNAHDRRVIHLALKSDPSLETRSVGKGEMRKLVIHLADNGKTKGHEGSDVSS